MSCPSFEQSSGVGSVTVIVCSEALNDQSPTSTVRSPAMGSPPLAFTTALLIE